MSADALGEKERLKRAITLIKDDLDASGKIIEGLQARSAALDEEILNSQYKIDELQVELESGPQKVTDEIENPSFMDLFSSLEQEETELKAKIDTIKFTQRGRPKKLRDLRTDIATLERRLRETEEVNEEKEGQLKVLQGEADVLDTELLELQKQMIFEDDEEDAIFDAELNELQNSLKQQQSDKNEMAVRIEESRNRLKQIEQKINDASRRREKAAKQNHKQIELNSSMKSWLSEREVLKMSLKRAKEAEAAAKAEQQAQQKRSKQLNQKSSAIFEGTDEDFDEIATRIVEAEINFINEEASGDDYLSEYEAEVERHLEVVRESLEEFKKHKEEIMASMEIEYKEALGDAYLQLMEEDYSQALDKNMQAYKKRRDR